MFFNFRYPVILFILSMAGMMLGLVFKMMNWQGGQLLMGSMIMVQALSIVWLIILIIRTPKN
jgi:hypothetical protein